MQPEDLNQADVPVSETEEPAINPIVEPASEPVDQPFWGYSDLAILTSWCFLVMLAASFGVFFYMRLVLIIQIVAYLAMYLGFRVVFKMTYARDVFNSLGWHKTKVNLLSAGLGGVLLAFGLNLVASLIHTPKVKTPFDNLGDTPASLALLAVIAVLLAPLAEEMFFRGFWQPLLSKSLGAAGGICLTAFLFGLLHGSEYQWAWQYVAAITTVGLVLGVVRARTHSIIPGVVMHGCFNSLAIIGFVAQKYINHK